MSTVNFVNGCAIICKQQKVCCQTQPQAACLYLVITNKLLLLMFHATHHDVSVLPAKSLTAFLLMDISRKADIGHTLLQRIMLLCYTPC